MKRFVCFLLCFAVLLPCCAYAAPLKDSQLDINAPAAVLMEKSTGQVLYEKNAHRRCFPASITKIMTMLLIVEDIESGTLSLDDTVTASARASSFGGSCVYLAEGEQMSVSEMLKCIAVVSANDCAVAMAEHISGSEELFVERMNQRAAQLGLADTHFTGCTGLFDEKDHYTTAYDVAVMSRELIRHDLIKEYSTIWMDSIRGGEFELSNTNKLVYWYDGCTGLKTGYTSASKYCLSATAERDGLEFIAVVMGGDSSDSRNDDATFLLNYAFAGFELCPLRPERPLGDITVEMGEKRSARLEYGGDEFALVGKTGAQPEFSLSVESKVRAPVLKGQRLGTLTVTLGGTTVAQVPVCAAEDVPRIGYFGIVKRLAGSLFGF